jgi:hypothetical protein
MKHIKRALIIVALFAALSADAKQIGKKTEAVIQPSYAKATEDRPAPAPQPQPVPKPQPMPQPQTQNGYTNILNQLKQLQPTTNDWDTLKAIKDEVQDQMGKAFNPALAKKPAPTSKEALLQIENRAKAIFQQYPVNFNKTQQQINDAAIADKDIFTMQEQMDIIDAIFDVVKAIVTEFPTISSQTVYDAIIAFHPGFKELAKKLTKNQSDDVTNFIKQAVNNSYAEIKRKK